MDDLLSPLIPSASQDGPGWEDAPFLARLTSVQTGTGTQAGLYLYGFVEQTYDPTTGIPADADPGRTDDLQTQQTTYALEVDNQLVPGLTATPPALPLPAWTNPLPSPLPYPYVWMRLKGVVNGAPVYEFELPAAAESSVRVTSTALTPFSLAGGGGNSGYPAVISTFNPAGGWTDGAVCWAVAENGIIPSGGTTDQFRFDARLIGTDTAGKSVWAIRPPAVLVVNASGSVVGPMVTIKNSAIITLDNTGGGASEYQINITPPNGSQVLVGKGGTPVWSQSFTDSLGVQFSHMTAQSYRGTGGTFTIPSAASSGDGMVTWVVNIGTGSLILNPTSGDSLLVRNAGSSVSGITIQPGDGIGLISWIATGVQGWAVFSAWGGSNGSYPGSSGVLIGQDTSHVSPSVVTPSGPGQVLTSGATSPYSPAFAAPAAPTTIDGGTW